jgi:structural maintenance of chromosome 2
MRLSIKQLKEDTAHAKVRHNEATKDVRRIERDMAEFSSNKDSKLAELKGSLEKLKKALSKSNESIRPLQQDMREAMLDSEQCGSDLAAAQEQVHDIQVTISAQKEELDGLVEEQDSAKVHIFMILGSS